MSTANVTQTGQSSTVTVTVSRGLQGPPGSDATVTTEAIETALGYTPADAATNTGTNTGDQDLSGLATQSALAAETAAREAAIAALGTAAEEDTGTTPGTIPLLGSNGALPVAQGGTGATIINTSPALFTTTNQNALYIAAAADFDSNALTYITATGKTGTNAFVIDDVVKMLKGSASSTSRRGSTWATLSVNRWTNVKGIYLFQSAYNHGSSTIVRDLKATMNLTIAGGMAWNSNGFTFDGVNDQLTGTGAHITSGQWSLMAVARVGNAGSNVIACQATNYTNFRTNFMDSNGSVPRSFKRVDPTSYLTTGATASTTENSFLTVQTATDLKIFAGGSETAEATTALAATTIENTTFLVGNSGITGTRFTGEMKLVILWAEDISTDYAEIHANLNSLLGLGL
jgi:hypothetical protein